MGQDEINQMKQALVRRGFVAYKIDRDNEAELRRRCNNELSHSLTGKFAEYINLDSFHKQYNFNMLYTLPDGKKIKVAKVGTSTMKSGRKIEAFVDIAGNQYFQYRAADNKIIKKEYFNKQEKITSEEYFEFSNDSIYKHTGFEELINKLNSPKKENNDLTNISVLVSNSFTKECERLVEKIHNSLNNKQDLEQLLNKNIDKFDDISYEYSKKYNRNLIEDITNSNILDEKSKENYLKKINHYYDKLEIKDSKIKNEFWEGDSFNIKFQGNNIFITNNSTKEKSFINMDDLFKNMKLINKVPMMKYFQELPGEVLFDISKECKKIDSIKEDTFNKITNMISGILFGEVAGYYRPITDKITAGNDFNLVHELGHAIDHHYRCKIFNYAETELDKNFDKAFETGLQRYEQDKHTKNNRIKIFGKGEYCTTNKQEMFAMCYNILMTGIADKCILYYFPECLEETKNILKATRKLHKNIRSS